MKIFKSFCFLFVSLSLFENCRGAQISPYSAIYIGYQVWSVQPETQTQVNYLRELERLEEYDFWSTLRQNHEIDIKISSKRANLLAHQFKQFGLNWKVKITDLGKFIEEQRITNNLLRGTGDMSWTAFHTYDEIVSWLQSLPELYPGLATLEIIGNSSEGRDIHVLKISKNDGNEKPAIFFEGTFHSKEWIAPATLTWVINEILATPDHSLLSKADLYFVPIANPDGYEYSHTTERLWQKTRNYINGTCYGTNVNRNMPYQFGGAGSSDDPCNDIYRGPFALSTPEAKSVVDFILKLQTKQKINSYLTVHSMGNIWLLPWNYESELYSEDYYTHLLPWGQASTKAMSDVRGDRFTAGQAANILRQNISGTSLDWAKSIGIKYSATISLTTPKYGYVPPPSEIIPAGKELLAGILVIESTFE